jgi:putative DNA primase/helicase
MDAVLPENVTADQFVQTIFANATGAPVVALIRPAKPGGSGYRRQYPWQPEFFAHILPGSWYFCISTTNTVEPGGYARRRKADLACTACVVIDDVGTKTDRSRVETVLPPPSWMLKTSSKGSAGNFQWGYILKSGAPPGDAETLIKRLAGLGLTDGGAKDAAHVFRLPGSLNEKYDPPFAAELTLWQPERRYTLDELATNLPPQYGEDPVVAWLERRGMVHHYRPDGGFDITCHQAARHSTGTDGDSSTTYWPASGGRKPGFACLHENCAEIGVKDLYAWIKTTDPKFKFPRPAKADRPPPPDREASWAEIARLAELDPIAYARERVAAADKLGVTVGFLDREVKRARTAQADDKAAPPDIEPWPDEVDGTTLLKAIAAAVKRHVYVSTRAEDAIALWVLFAHTIDAHDISPRLAALSPVKECGKTSLLVLLGDLTPKPVRTSNITAAAVFRMTDRWHPTLIFDEGDAFLDDKSELRSILNSGHTPAYAFVWRVEGDNHELVRFSTWTPIAVAAIGKLWPTLESRCIVITMERKPRGMRLERYREDKQPYADLARKAARWAADNIDDLRGADPKMPEGFENRRADNWRPLFAIAEAIGGEWPGLAHEAAITLEGVSRSQERLIELLEDIRPLLPKPEQVDAEAMIASKTIVDHLVSLEGRPWPEYRRGKPITQNGLARLLKRLHVEPVDGWDSDAKASFKGYVTSVLATVCDQYLTPPEA